MTHDKQPVGTPRQIERGTGGKRTWPQPPAAEQPELAAAGRNLDPKELDKLQERIARRIPNKGDVALLGAHLFDALLGQTLWDTIKKAPEAANAPGIELALKFPAAKTAAEDLARLHWEMLRDASDFLVRGVRGGNRLCRVAITRMAPGVKVEPRAMNLPPRALFVVGCDVNDARIRPGAEFLGLLRQVRNSAHPRTFHPRVLVRASVERIKEEVLSFQPDVVHFICHGTDNGWLEFAPEPGEPPGTPARLLGAQDVCDLFKKPDASGMTWQPTIVVLSACNSAQSLTADQTAPLAARLVAEGVPVVIGMAGRVADQACRLFTRSFGEALCVGRPLVEATEVGRRAAFASEYLARSLVAKLHGDVEQELTAEKKPTVKALVFALRHDLEQLLEAARKAPDSPVSGAGRPVLFIDDLELLGIELLRALFSGAEMLVGEEGLGNPGARIPLVVAFRLQNDSQSLYEDTLKKIRAEWAGEIALAQFDRQHDEDLAAYRQVLLNPHDETRVRDISNKRWIIRDEASPDIAKEWLPFLRDVTLGIPADFNTVDFTAG